MAQRLPNSIRELARQYQAGHLTPDHIAKQCEQNVARLKELNIFTSLAPALTRSLATEATERLKIGRPLGLLDGVPVAVKDNFCVADLPTTCASRMLQDFRPPYSATVYERLRSQGAIFVGKTNLDQFGMGSGTVDSSFGPTRNPWQYAADGWHIAGGSSGGSAAAVASGLCYAALGSDTGGSTRNPASYCGVVGLKPTYGLLSRHGLIALVNSMDVPGILTRTVDDCAVMLNAMAGTDPMDSTTLTEPGDVAAAVEPLDVRGLRVGIPAEYHCEGLTTEVLDTWRKVADLLEQAGAHVQCVSLPHTASSIFVYTILNQCEVASNMSRYDGIEFGHRAEQCSGTEELYARTREEGFNTVVKNRILSGNYYLLRRNYGKYFEKALRVRRLIANDFRTVFGNVDVLLTPTTLSDAPTYDEFRQFSNRDQCALQDFCTQPANMAGIPAISLPVRLSERGLPLSLQLMGDRLSDGKLLGVAKWIEEQVRFPHRPVGGVVDL